MIPTERRLGSRVSLRSGQRAALARAGSAACHQLVPRTCLPGGTRAKQGNPGGPVSILPVMEREAVLTPGVWRGRTASEARCHTWGPQSLPVIQGCSCPSLPLPRRSLGLCPSDGRDSRGYEHRAPRQMGTWQSDTCLLWPNPPVTSLLSTCPPSPAISALSFLLFPIPSPYSPQPVS